MFSTLKSLSLYLGVFAIGGSLALAISQQQPKQLSSTNTEANRTTVFPDRFSDLDDVEEAKNTPNKEYLNQKLKSARRFYLQGLVHLDAGDTARATKSYSKAMDELNALVSYYDIEKNEEFAELAQSILEDYESIVDNTKLLDENTPFYLIKNKLFANQEETEELDIAEDDTEIYNYTPPTSVKTSDYNSIPLTENEAVQKNIEWFSQTEIGRKYMKLWLGRTTRWFDMYKRIAMEEGMPEDIIHLSMIESGLKPDAVSKAKAVGLWQFMRGTGQDYNLNSSNSKWIDERRDPEKATRAAMRYLKDLYNMFGDWHLAIASYNCGQGRVARTIAKSGQKEATFWSIRHLLPKETRHYVPLFIATTLITHNPEKYGFKREEFVYSDAYEYDIFRINEPVALSVIAKCCNVSDSVIVALNPELVKSITPPDVPDYQLKIPKGSVQTFVANFASLSSDEKLPWVIHTVQRRETLKLLANKYGVGLVDLASMNNLMTRSKLKTGAQLKIPITQQKYNDLANNDNSGDNPLDGSKDVVHTVKKGENLAKIATKYGVSLNKIRVLNGISSSKDNIYIGQKLYIVRKDDSKAESNLASNKSNVITGGKSKIVKHKVKKGENLAQIANKYNVSIEDVKSANKLKSDKVNYGTTLKIATNSLASNPNTNIEIDNKPVSAKLHKVNQGETLAQIARNYGTSADNIIALNELPGETIYAGQVLRVEGSVAKVGSSENVLPLNTNTLVHKVRKGESLGLIAAKYGVTEDDLVAWNKDKIEGTTVFAGANLKVKQTGTSKGSNIDKKSVNASPTFYTVSKGDTMSSISKRFGVSTANIVSLNKNLNPDKISIGQKIRVK